MLAPPPQARNVHRKLLLASWQILTHAVEVTLPIGLSLVTFDSLAPSQCLKFSFISVIATICVSLQNVC